jgi:signal transduction histidine kinase
LVPLSVTSSLRQGGPADVDLSAVVRDVRRWAAREPDGIEVQETIVARADPRLLGQITRLHVYGSPTTAVLSVRDNGPGIAPEIRDRIFEPFFTTRRGQGGTGLGLALCREYARQMQARITLWTAPGRGSYFRVHMGRCS